MCFTKRKIAYFIYFWGCIGIRYFLNPRSLRQYLDSHDAAVVVALMKT